MSEARARSFPFLEKENHIFAFFSFYSKSTLLSSSSPRSSLLVVPVPRTYEHQLSLHLSRFQALSLEWRQFILALHVLLPITRLDPVLHLIELSCMHSFTLQDQPQSASCLAVLEFSCRVYLLLRCAHSLSSLFCASCGFICLLEVSIGLLRVRKSLCFI